MNNTNTYTTLSKISVSEHIEKKNGLSYLSWAWAWDTLKKIYPQAKKTIYENSNGYPIFYDKVTQGAFVKVSVTIDEVEEIVWLPVMDYNNKTIPLDRITSFNINTAIQRGLTKAIAQHGLGMYIYAGEDLPNIDNELQDAISNAHTIEQLTDIYNQYKPYFNDSNRKGWLTYKRQQLERETTVTQ